MCLPVACLTTGPSMARPVLLVLPLGAGYMVQRRFVQRVAEQIGFGADARIVVNAARHAEQLPDGHVAFAFGTNVGGLLPPWRPVSACRRQSPAPPPCWRTTWSWSTSDTGFRAWRRQSTIRRQSAAAHHQNRLRTVPLQPVSHLVQPCPGHSVAIGPGGFPLGNRPCGLPAVRSAASTRRLRTTRRPAERANGEKSWRTTFQSPCPCILQNTTSRSDQSKRPKPGLQTRPTECPHSQKKRPRRPEPPRGESSKN